MELVESWWQAPTSAMMPAPVASPRAMPTDPDASDIAHAASGDPRAFARLVDRHLARVHRLAWRTLGNDADAQEVAQDTFLRAFTQLPQWRSGQARFSTWSYRVAFNLCQDRLRGRRDYLPVEDLDLSDPQAGPEIAMARLQRLERIEDAMAQLPQRQREALLLCHYEGQSQEAAAEILGVSVEAVESLLARARRALRAMLPVEPAAHARTVPETKP